MLSYSVSDTDRATAGYDNRITRQPCLIWAQGKYRLCVCVSAVFLGGLSSSKRSVWIGSVRRFTFRHRVTTTPPRIWIIPRYLWPVHLFLEGMKSKEHFSFCFKFPLFFFFSLAHTREDRSLQKEDEGRNVSSARCQILAVMQTQSHTHTFPLRCGWDSQISWSAVGRIQGGCRLDSRNWSNLALFFLLLLTLSTFFK